MRSFLIYNFSGELDDISHLLPNERLGRAAAILHAAGHQVELRDRANLGDLDRFGPTFMKNLGSLGFYQSNDLYQQGVEKEADDILAGGFNGVLINLWHGTGFKFSVDLARLLKQRAPYLQLIGIGQKVDWYREHIFRLADNGFDGLVVGLGYDFVTALSRGLPLAECPGVIIKTRNGFTLPERRTLDVTDFPRADYDLYGALRDKVPVYTVTVSNQACPNYCVYCIRPENYGRVNVRRDTRQVLDELADLHFNRGVRHFRVEDSTPPAMALTSLARGILDSPLKDKIRLSAFCRIDTNAGEDFHLLHAAGFKAIFFGIETLDDALLASIHKGISFEGVRSTLDAAHSAGIATVGSFIFPLPGESMQSMANTLNRLRIIRKSLDSLLVLPAAVYPPTEWGKTPGKFGITLDDDYYEKFVAYPLKYLLPMKYWPPVPFRYKIDYRDGQTDDFAQVLAMYAEFAGVVRNELRLPSVPDYYYLLADLLEEEPAAATAKLVNLMISRDYSGLRALFKGSV